MGSNRADQSKCTQYTYGLTQNFIQNSNSKYFKSKKVIQRSNLGQIRVKFSQVVEIYPIYICFASKFCQEFKFKIFEVKSGHQKVKLGSRPSNQGHIGPSHQNMSNMHLFRLKFLSRILIQDYLRSNQTTQGSNQGQKVSNLVRIGPSSRNISSMHVFRLRIL